MGVELIDTDHLIEQKSGKSVSEIFEQCGELAFRQMERDALVEISQREGFVVIATGGGLPTWSDNMELLNQIGESVYLCRSAESIAKRMSPNGRQRRPKLRGLDDEQLVAFMRGGIAERERYYSQARYIIDCDAFSDAQVAERILGLIESNEK